jgi:hypothetical protein
MVCDEAAELLKDKQVALTGFRILKKMKPIRQIEAAQLMVAMNKFTINYARSLLAATPENQLVSAANRLQVEFNHSDFKNQISDPCRWICNFVGISE